MTEYVCLKILVYVWKKIPNMHEIRLIKNFMITVNYSK